MIARWWRRDAVWWQVWLPQSGLAGGWVCGTALGVALYLSGCAGQQVTLTDASQTACKGQAAANIATDAALVLGQPGAAAASGAISAALGVLCKW